ncbi:MAG: MBL fold metallo-hydrolase [Candidatus Thermoplasmatota archaeon]|nr:MBL fold metallo-hydrolase [Candidatus Thermoplasmatota archaeon]
MTEEILPGIFRIELPLPRNPLRSINSYVLLGEDRNLVIDTGMNRQECKEVLDKGIEELGLDLSVADVMVTHLHADHLGLAPHITKGRTKVFMGAQDIALKGESSYWSSMLEYAIANGFPDEDPRETIRKHPGYKYGPLGEMDLHPLRGNEILHYGGRELEVIHTPGHSIGHMCLYDRREKVLFSGDHVLGDITPNISQWADGENMLFKYIASLRKVRDLDVDLVLPGHRTPVRDHKRRIDELIKHHHERAEEVMEILQEGELDGMTVASRMKWDLTIKRFEDFPIMQKWFALGEAIAHIGFLEMDGRIGRTRRGKRVMYHVG